MKPVQRCLINGREAELAALSLVLTLNAAGRGFITVNNFPVSQSLGGATVQIDLGRNGQAWRYFSGYVERDQPADNGSRRLFIREAAGILDFDFPCSLQHPTLRDVLNHLSHQSGIVFITADSDYTTTPVPYATHSGSGTQLLSQLGRTFSIPDYVWHPMPDGSVFVGSAADSRFASLSLPDIPPEYALGSSAGNSMDIMLIETIRPGVNLPAGRITRVAVNDEQMTLTWERLDENGKPLSRSPLRRQIENQFPELGSGTMQTRLARVVAPTEPTALGDISDPFRPRYAVDLQLLDEDGNDKSSTPVWSAVPLPVPMAGSEAGCFAYPPAGTLVEISHVEGRPDKPVIRQVMPSGHSLPDIRPGEQLQQQRAEVFQRITTDGSWNRETDQQIQEKSARRAIHSDREDRKTITRNTTVQANDDTTVLGTSTLRAGQVAHCADGDYGIVASHNIQMKAAGLIAKLQNAVSDISSDRTETIGGNESRSVQGNVTETVGGTHTTTASGGLSFSAPTLFLGRGGAQGEDKLNLMTLFIDILDLIEQLAQHAASHTHPGTGTPGNSSAFTADASQSSALRSKYRNLIA
ncbi:hypothetical protein RMO93_21990 [Escherichia coli]|uniref:hypothetical protein n=1 Tax=Escherichia coli TaxID=562 RepID=UPI001B106D9A|nr:hypothetical protein [Escherichia coli]WNK03481.1 hypothetical protein RMO93_21990 [Escherichia coli]HBA7229770.1 hypothetical protein [Escherichia coli]